MTQRQIERQVDIEAPLERVWTLVSEPGWWINDGEVIAHQIERDENGARVTDPVHGTFLVQTLAADPPRYVRFGWGNRVDEPAGGSTTVEFWLDASGSTVTLRVRETGFDDLPGSEEERSAAYEDNQQGWRVECEAIRRHFLKVAERV